MSSIPIIHQYTTNYKRGDNSIPIKVNYTGNGVKSLQLSVEASLKKLRTTYIDILYVHWWDWTATVEEVMNALHNVVASGKVMYLVSIEQADTRKGRARCTDEHGNN